MRQMIYDLEDLNCPPRGELEKEDTETIEIVNSRKYNVEGSAEIYEEHNKSFVDDDVYRPILDIEIGSNIESKAERIIGTRMRIKIKMRVENGIMKWSLRILAFEPFILSSIMDLINNYNRTSYTPPTSIARILIEYADNRIDSLASGSCQFPNIEFEHSEIMSYIVDTTYGPVIISKENEKEIWEPKIYNGQAEAYAEGAKAVYSAENNFGRLPRTLRRKVMQDMESEEDKILASHIYETMKEEAMQVADELNYGTIGTDVSSMINF